MNPNQPGTYPAFFRAATGGHSPYPWQIRLAEDPVCRSRLIDIPTGLGKTAGVVLAWLWQQHLLPPSRISNPESQMRCPAAPWPRRLVYCLPMRTLVEQTAEEAKKWIANVAQAASLCSKSENHSQAGCATTKRPRVVILMGGESLEGDAKDWDLYPEEPAILIGTQDMLLSRALNRGYGMSRYRWPMHFALLNNDALWVMDEVQLMGVGVETSAQLQGLRAKLATSQDTATWWMSATLDRRQLETNDFAQAAEQLPQIRLVDADRATEAVAKREGAAKPISQAKAALNGTTAAEEGKYIKALASEILQAHGTAEAASDGLTLVILNRVSRAQELFKLLLRDFPEKDCLLIHSRFRGIERRAQRHALARLGKSGGLVVATQAIEAGVDLSARVLFTELAPWASLVQRFGRANRKGEFNAIGGSKLFWMDLANDPKAATPYEASDLAAARKLLQDLTDASPKALAKAGAAYKPARPVRPVVRRKDVLELFDTTPDLTGSDIDVSRYIREGDDSDVLVWWHPLGGARPPVELPAPAREWLCRVSIGQFKAFLGAKTKPKAYRWNPTLVTKSDKWEIVREGIPGHVYLLDAGAPGYDRRLGWAGDPKSKPLTSLPPDGKATPEADEREDDTFTGQWQTLADHTREVMEEVDGIARSLSLPDDLRAALADAARWHDTGKAHPVFREMIAQAEAIPENFPKQHWAKSVRRKDRYPRYSRRGFRHELASALLYRQQPRLAESSLPKIVAYLIAAHHGKVRASLRSLPSETKPDSDTLFARGVWHGDVLPPPDGPPLLLPGLKGPVPPTELNLGCIRLGQDSWTGDALALLQTFGPFRLAFLEALLRSADGRRSREFPGSEEMVVQESSAAYGSASRLSAAEQTLAEAIAAEGLAIQDRFRPEPLYKQTGKGHYESRTVEDIQRAKKKGKDRP